MRTQQQNQRNQQQKSTSEKKYCAVCHKAGKLEKEYTNHYTKSTPGPNGIVVCPTILTNHCKKCNGYGHFSDHCLASAKASAIAKATAKATVIAKVEKKPELEYEDMWPAIGQVVGTKRPRDGNQFAALDNDAMPKPKAIKHTMNFKKVLETEYVEPKEDNGFVGNILVMNGKSTEVVKAILSGSVKPKQFNLQEEEEEEEYWEQEYDDIDYEEEIDRRIEAQSGRFASETWGDAW